MNNCEKEEYYGFPYAIIPQYILFDRELEPNARLLYACLCNLSRKEGYCWASNKYLAENFEVDERTIKRWLESLKIKEYIFIDVEKNGFKTERKIWITREFKEIFTKGQKCPPRGDKNVPLEGTKMSPSRGQKCPPIYNKLYKYNKEEQQQQPPTPKPLDIDQPENVAVAFFDCLKDLDIPDTGKETLMKYPEEKLIKAIEFAKSKKQKPENLVGFIIWHCEDDNPPVPPDELTSNQRLALKFNQELEKYEGKSKEIAERNKENIKKEYMEICDEFGRITKTSLKMTTNTYEELNKDFNNCRKGIPVLLRESLKFKQKQGAIESKNENNDYGQVNKEK